jgi:4'-phosphopantetheinyl transferase
VTAGPSTTSFAQPEVQVWAVELNQPTSTFAKLRATLSQTEVERAERFHFDRDRRRFGCTRGALRLLLAEHLGAHPRDLSFTYNACGKPALGGQHAGALSFNVSHSDELALIAVAHEAITVGIDVERVRTMRDCEGMARRFFAPGEVARLLVLPASKREQAFFDCWTRKEAYLKALGDGLSRPLDTFEVTFASAEPISLMVVGDELESGRWAFIPLDPAPGYAATLVASLGFTTVRSCGRFERWPRD